MEYSNATARVNLIWSVCGGRYVVGMWPVGKVMWSRSGIITKHTEFVNRHTLHLWDHQGARGKSRRYEKFASVPPRHDGREDNVFLAGVQEISKKCWTRPEASGVSWDPRKVPQEWIAIRIAWTDKVEASVWRTRQQRSKVFSSPRVLSANIRDVFVHHSRKGVARSSGDDRWEAEGLLAAKVSSPSGDS